MVAPIADHRKMGQVILQPRKDTEDTRPAFRGTIRIWGITTEKARWVFTTDPFPKCSVSSVRWRVGVSHSVGRTLPMD
jgi:hypothetical protein